MLRKGEMKTAPWLLAYEDWNVDIGLACGLRGHAQIGKGMWAMPDEMRAMVETKIGAPAGPARTAPGCPRRPRATLHAMHYHQVDVAARQAELAAGGPRAESRRHPDRSRWRPGRRLDRRGDPAGARQQLPGHPRLRGALGRSGRRLLEGAGHQRRRPDGGPRHPAHLQPASSPTGCTTASSAEEQVMETLQRMAAVVDAPERRRSGLPADGTRLRRHRLQAAADLIFKGREVPNGYTEPSFTPCGEGSSFNNRPRSTDASSG